MADAILMSGGVGGVTSDDVTARREHVLQGYTALTADGDDEPVQGTIPDKGVGNINARPDVMDWGNSRMSIVMQEGYYHGNNGNPWVWATFSDLQKLVKIAPSQVLETATYLGVKGGIKVVDTKANNYSVNASKQWGLDANRRKFWAVLGHGNAYYAREDNNPHVDIPAEAFGTAGADSVLQWQTASSQNGIKFEGSIKRWICNTGDVISADNSTIGPGLVYDDPHGRGRGIVVGIKNNAYIQGANYVFLPLPTLLAHNVREGVNIGGMVGTMKDYGAGRTVFNGATFDGILATGVATKGFSSNGIYYAHSIQSDFRYSGIYGGGMNLNISTAYPVLRSRRIGCVLSQSINATPFRQVVVYYRSVANIQGSPYVSLEAHVSRASVRGYESIVGTDVDTIDVIRLGTASPAINREGQIILDVSTINEQIFLSFGAYCNYDRTSDKFEGAIQITKIDFLN